VSSNDLPRDEDEAAESVVGGEAVAAPSLSSLVGGLAAVASQVGPVARQAAGVGREAVRIARGSSELAPDPKDRRFSDPAWDANPVYRRTAQTYLNLANAMDALVDEFEQGDVDWQRVEEARFAIGLLASALAPTNFLPGNPKAMKHAFDTGGRSVVRGMRNWVGDLRHNGGMPSQTDRTAFEVGRDLAVTPGAVVYRSEVAEILHYRSSTSDVHARPVLVVPPPIGRYYFLDLRPGRSFVEYAVSRGLQVFLVSWRNPGPDQADWDLDIYIQGLLDVITTVCEIAGSEDLNAVGLCAGGILLSSALSHLAQHDEHPVHSASFAVTLLDFGQPAQIGAFSAPRLLGMARQSSRRKGVISARSMGQVFSLMRPDDLVFNYVINNYLMGEDPPVFDILAWNADGTNLPAALHRKFLDIFQNNTLCEAGAVTVLGTPVDLSRVELPVFVTGAVTDHLTPWKGCYRTTQLLSGEATFVLSNAGHIASLVNPPGNPKASYHAGGSPGPDPDQWLAAAEHRTGSWWEAWADWVIERAGEQRTAPAELGSSRFPPLEEAPGRYVRDLAP
jgi:polyhydroxyalkanoate synthase subunit PhaC